MSVLLQLLNVFGSAPAAASEQRPSGGGGGGGKRRKRSGKGSRAGGRGGGAGGSNGSETHRSSGRSTLDGSSDADDEGVVVEVDSGSSADSESGSEGPRSLPKASTAGPSSPADAVAAMLRESEHAKRMHLHAVELAQAKQAAERAAAAEAEYRAARRYYSSSHMEDPSEALVRSVVAVFNAELLRARGVPEGVKEGGDTWHELLQAQAAECAQLVEKCMSDMYEAAGTDGQAAGGWDDADKITARLRKLYCPAPAAPLSAPAPAPAPAPAAPAPAAAPMASLMKAATASASATAVAPTRAAKAKAAAPATSGTSASRARRGPADATAIFQYLHGAGVAAENGVVVSGGGEAAVPTAFAEQGAEAVVARLEYVASRVLTPSPAVVCAVLEGYCSWAASVTSVADADNADAARTTVGHFFASSALEGLLHNILTMGCSGVEGPGQAEAVAVALSSLSVLLQHVLGIGSGGGQLLDCSASMNEVLVGELGALLAVAANYCHAAALPRSADSDEETEAEANGGRLDQRAQELVGQLTRALAGGVRQLHQRLGPVLTAARVDSYLASLQARVAEAEKAAADTGSAGAGADMKALFTERELRLDVVQGRLDAASSALYAAQYYQQQPRGLQAALGGDSVHLVTAAELAQLRNGLREGVREAAAARDQASAAAPSPSAAGAASALNAARARATELRQQQALLQRKLEEVTAELQRADEQAAEISRRAAATAAEKAATISAAAASAEAANGTADALVDGVRAVEDRLNALLQHAAAAEGCVFAAAVGMPGAASAAVGAEVKAEQLAAQYAASRGVVMTSLRQYLTAECACVVAVCGRLKSMCGPGGKLWALQAELAEFTGLGLGSVAKHVAASVASVESNVAEDRVICRVVQECMLDALAKAATVRGCADMFARDFVAELPLRSILDAVGALEEQWQQGGSAGVLAAAGAGAGAVAVRPELLELRRVAVNGGFSIPAPVRAPAPAPSAAAAKESPKQQKQKQKQAASPKPAAPTPAPAPAKASTSSSTSPVRPAASPAEVTSANTAHNRTIASAGAGASNTPTKAATKSSAGSQQKHVAIVEPPKDGKDAKADNGSAPLPQRSGRRGAGSTPAAPAAIAPAPAPPPAPVPVPAVKSVAPTTADAAPGVCFAFQLGSCTRGDACKFSHTGPGASAGRAPVTPTTPNNGAKTGVCFAFQRGECTRGDSCKFHHKAANAAGPHGAGGGGSSGRGRTVNATSVLSNVHLDAAGNGTSRSSPAPAPAPSATPSTTDRTANGSPDNGSSTFLSGSASVLGAITGASGALKDAKAAERAALAAKAAALGGPQRKAAAKASTSPWNKLPPGDAPVAIKDIQDEQQRESGSAGVQAPSLAQKLAGTSGSSSSAAAAEGRPAAEAEAEEVA